MKNKIKYLLSLFMCIILTSCNNKVFVGIDRVNDVPNTVMGVEITNEIYDISDINVKLYLGFKDVDVEYPVIFGVYSTLEYQTDFELMNNIRDYTSIRDHQFIKSFTQDEAITEFGFSVKRKKVKYENSIDVNVKYLSYKSSRNGAIHFKVIAYTKSTDGTYIIITDKGLNQVISIYYNRLDSKVRLYGNSDYNYANSF